MCTHSVCTQIGLEVVDLFFKNKIKKAGRKCGFSFIVLCFSGILLIRSSIDLQQQAYQQLLYTVGVLCIYSAVNTVLLSYYTHRERESRESVELFVVVHTEYNIVLPTSVGTMYTSIYMHLYL